MTQTGSRGDRKAPELQHGGGGSVKPEGGEEGEGRKQEAAGFGTGAGGQAQLCCWIQMELAAARRLCRELSSLANRVLLEQKTVVNASFSLVCRAALTSVWGCQPDHLPCLLSPLHILCW